MSTKPLLEDAQAKRNTNQHQDVIASHRNRFPVWRVRIRREKVTLDSALRRPEACLDLIERLMSRPLARLTINFGSFKRAKVKWLIDLHNHLTFLREMLADISDGFRTCNIHWRGRRLSR